MAQATDFFSFLFYCVMDHLKMFIPQRKIDKYVSIVSLFITISLTTAMIKFWNLVTKSKLINDHQNFKMAD
jgi:hypothetical protein